MEAKSTNFARIKSEKDESEIKKNGKDAYKEGG